MLYTFFANPVVNIPPVLNSGIELANHNISNLIIGYKTTDTPRTEFLNYGSRIFRVDLKSRKIKIGFIRKLCSIIEFIIISRRIAQRSNAKHIILFNEIASILGRFIKNKKQIHWSLEFPENETKTKSEGFLKRVAYQAWEHADVLIFPTNYRKAMGMVLNPNILHKKLLTIHNAPLLGSNTTHSEEFSENTNTAIQYINKQSELQKKVIIYAGAVGNRYGWDSLIEAVGNIEKQYALLILGTKHELGDTEFAASINKCAYPENILWLDAIPYFEMQAVIKKVDIGFVHYRGDTLNTYFSAPGKLYEYLKAGLAILTDENACISQDLTATNSSLMFATPLNSTELKQLLAQTSADVIDTKKKDAYALFSQKYHFEEQLTPLISILNQ